MSKATGLLAPAVLDRGWDGAESAFVSSCDPEEEVVGTYWLRGTLEFSADPKAGFGHLGLTWTWSCCWGQNWCPLLR